MLFQKNMIHAKVYGHTEYPTENSTRLKTCATTLQSAYFCCSRTLKEPREIWEINLELTLNYPYGCRRMTLDDNFRVSGRFSTITNLQVLNKYIFYS